MLLLIPFVSFCVGKGYFLHGRCSACLSLFTSDSLSPSLSPYKLYEVPHLFVATSWNCEDPYKFTLEFNQIWIGNLSQWDLARPPYIYRPNPFPFPFPFALALAIFDATVYGFRFCCFCWWCWYCIWMMLAVFFTLHAQPMCDFCIETSVWEMALALPKAIWVVCSIQLVTCARKMLWILCLFSFERSCTKQSGELMLLSYL